MTLREELDRIWRDPLVRCSHHLVLWSSKPHGYEETEHLWYRRGRKVQLRGLRRHRRTWLCRDYGFFARCRMTSDIRSINEVI